MTSTHWRTERICLRGEEGAAAALGRAAAVLARGGLAAFPTETVYGLGCDAANAEARARIARLKGQPPEKPFQVLVASLEEAERLCGPLSRPARKLMRCFWPGPLTLVLPAKDRPAPSVERHASTDEGPLQDPRECHGQPQIGRDGQHACSGAGPCVPIALARGAPGSERPSPGEQEPETQDARRKTRDEEMIGVRVPDHADARALLRAFGRPLAATSANAHGGMPADCAEAVERQFGGAIDLILDGGPVRLGLASTVAAVRGEAVAILRPGAVPEAELRLAARRTLLFVGEAGDWRGWMAGAIARRLLAARAPETVAAAAWAGPPPADPAWREAVRRELAEMGFGDGPDLCVDLSAAALDRADAVFVTRPERAAALRREMPRLAERLGVLALEEASGAWRRCGPPYRETAVRLEKILWSLCRTEETPRR